MKALLLLPLLLLGCATTDPYYDPSPKTELPDLPTVKGAGKVTQIPKGKLTDQQKDTLIARMRESERANAAGYNARGRAYEQTRRIYRGEQPATTSSGP